VEKRRIGALQVSVVGLGCNNFGGRLDLARTRDVVDAALDAGIDLLDTADIYGETRSESFLGQVLAGRRDRVVLATKFGMRIDDARQGAKPAYVARACEDSLRRLATDRIDLYQLHAPDASTPIADTLEALDKLVRAGKVREIGCSNFSAAQLAEARVAAGTGARFVSVQNELSLLHRAPERDGVLDLAAREHLGFLPFFPLASGVLTGKYRRGEEPPAGTRLAGMPSERAARWLDEAKLSMVEALEAYAMQRDHTVAELAIAWLAAKPAVASVIAGATRPEQVHANVRAAGWKLTAAEVAEIDALART